MKVSMQELALTIECVEMKLRDIKRRLEFPESATHQTELELKRIRLVNWRNKLVDEKRRLKDEIERARILREIQEANRSGNHLYTKEEQILR